MNFKGYFLPLALACLLALFLWVNIPRGHHRQAHAEDPEIGGEYSNCLQDGGTAKACDRMLAIMRKITTGAAAVSDRCEAGQTAALAECLERLHDMSYSGGGIDYDATSRAKDAPICEEIASVAYYACRNYKEGG